MSTTRILIVDDELVVRDSLARWFESEDFEVVTAPSAPEALEQLAQNRFDLALVDIKMPGVDGIELQQRLRQADAELPVIITVASLPATVSTMSTTRRMASLEPINCVSGKTRARFSLSLATSLVAARCETAFLTRCTRSSGSNGLVM